MIWLSHRSQDRGSRLRRTRRTNPLVSNSRISAPSRSGKIAVGKQLKHFWWGMLVSFLAFTVTACAALPDSGPVHEGEVNRDSRNPLAQLASGPIDGSSPEKLLADFQQACAAGTFDDYGIARQFLTTATRRSWNPQTQVTVLKPKTELEIAFSEEANEATGSGQPVLRVDKVGRASNFRRGETFKYALVKEGGQWRISSLPNGVVLTNTAFKNAFSKRNVYYWSNDHRFLIPDPRWLPRKNIAHFLLTALFSAPTSDLLGAVNAPETMTNIPSNLVTVQGRKARVELPDTLRLRSETEMTLLYQQVRTTLLNITGIDEVTVSQNGRSLPEPTEQAAPVKKHTMLGVKNGEVIEESDTRSGVFTAAAALAGEITWPTPGAAGSDFQVAIRGGKELVRLQRGKSPQVLYQGKNLRPPQVDPWGWAWTGDVSQTGDLVAVNSRFQVVRVKVPGGDRWKIPFFALSSPGVRGLIVWQMGYSFQGKAVTVIRAADGTPIQIVTGESGTDILSDVTSVAWTDSGQVAILQAGVTPKILVLAVNSYEESFEAAPKSQYLVPNPPDGDVQVVTERGVRMGHIQQSWRTLGSGVSYPAFSRTD